MSEVSIHPTAKITVYPKSIQTGRLPNGMAVTVFMAHHKESCRRLLGVQPADPAQAEVVLAGVFQPVNDPQGATEGARYFGLNPENAAVLRKMFTWLNPAPLESEPAGPQHKRSVYGKQSFGFCDRLGLATPGHIHALLAVTQPGEMLPIFAQQSVRENTRTGRTPQQVLDEAMWGVFQEGWQLPWGADADHLKTPDDLPPFVQAGYSFFTVDPGDHVDAAADSDTPETLQAKAAAQDWEKLGVQPASPEMLAAAYRLFCTAEHIACDEDSLPLQALRAQAKYGRAVLHITRMFRALQALKPEGFDFEASVDETETPTSIFEHFYIAGELTRLGVRITSLAPRLPGRFEKGVDFIGDLEVLEAELKAHVAVMNHFGGYKLSLHSGSDKFSVYPLMQRYGGKAVHVKTAGTSYLEALRVAAEKDPALFRQAVDLARERYPVDRVSYHVSADVARIPAGASVGEADLPALLDQFDVREGLHVTFGSALAQYGAALKALLCAQPEAYETVLEKHFKKHLDLLVG